MKKLSFLSLALVAGLSASAQSSMISEAPAKVAKQLREVPVDITPQASNRVDIWAEGFDTPSDWTMSRAASNANPHGWWINDSVYANTWVGWSAASFQLADGNFAFVNNGDPNGVGPAAPIVGEPFDLTYANAIDVTGYESTGFAVSFDIDGAKFVDDMETYVSGDGVLWTLVGDLSDVATLTNANPTNEINSVRRIYPVDPAAFGNSSTCYLRFTWNGETNGGNPNGVMYGMFLDNIKFEELPDNELKLLSFESIHGDTTVGLTQSWAMGQNPSDEIDERWFMAIVQNNGSGDRDVYVDLTITSEDGTIINIDNSADVLTIPGFGEQDTIYVNYAPAAWEIGDYSVLGTTRSVGVDLQDDATPGDNSRTSIFSITNNVFAANVHDYDPAQADHSNMIDVGNGFEEPQVVDYYNRWIQFEDMTFRGVSTTFRTGTEEGAKINFGLYATTANGQLDAASPIFVGKIYDESGTDVGIKSEHLSGRAFLPFQIAELQPDFSFIVSDTAVTLPGAPEGIIYAGGFQTPDDKVVIIESASTGGNVGNRQTSLEYGPFGENGALATFLSPAINVIEFYRVGDVTSVSEQVNRPTFYLAQNRPNPFNNGTTITYQLNKKANNISFEVFDVTGKQVMAINEGSKGAGQYNIELDGSEFTTGLYYYSLTVNGQKLTRKMVVTE